MRALVIEKKVQNLNRLTTTRRTGVGPGRDLGRPEPVSQTPTWTGLGALRSGYSAV